MGLQEGVRVKISSSLSTRDIAEECDKDKRVLKINLFVKIS